MSFCVVTGVGPRTGTSFVMQKAREVGLPISGEMFIDGVTINKHNPNGYWDINPFHFPTLLQSNKLDNTIVKVWPTVLQFIDVSKIKCIVVLERKNKQKQISSIFKVLNDELTLPINQIFYDQKTPIELIEESNNILNYYLKPDINFIKVYTEDLDSSIKNILDFLERGLSCQQ